MNRDLWFFITQFGDSALVLPLAALLTAALWRYESGRAAWLWTRAVLMCAAALACLKLLFLSYGYRWYERLESPSGHAGLSALVYGGLAAVLVAHLSARMSERSAWRMKLLVAVAVTTLVLAISLSRKLIGVHSVAEVLLGGLVGTGALVLFLRDYGTRAHPPMRLGLVFGAGLLLIVALPGLGFTPETYIWFAAQRIREEFRAPAVSSNEQPELKWEAQGASAP